MLNAAVWNVRGLNRRDHQIAVRELAMNSRLHFLGLLETRVTLPNAARVQNGILPRWKWFSDYNGAGNRIWLAWDDDFLDITIMDIGVQFVHCRIFIRSSHIYVLVTVSYGANDVGSRRELWQALSNISGSINDESWLVGGDFNAVRDLSEVCGTSGDIRLAMNEFNEYILNTGLIALPVQGERFTWHNCSDDGRSLWKRLDRFLANDKWMEQWPDLFYDCLTPGTSDHSPLVLSGDCRRPPVMLQQQAKIQWMKGGDQCSRVFFRKVAIRRENKRIFQISDVAGNTFTEPHDIINEFVAYYQKLLGGDRTDRAMDLRYLRPWARHIVTDEEASLLTLPITKDDVKTAVFDIEEDRAPGPDGYTSGFCKVAWPVVGEKITALPISCCNVIYKIITKILVLRIRGVLDKIISLSQSAFVPGRSISDNVLLAQELFSGYNQCRLPPHCALKVDLRKAYDTVEWDFLLATLQLFGFPPTFNKWIAECVTSPHLYLNSEVHGFFAGARGLRQGDPMSPYLFVLVMEVLHLILQQFIDQDGGFAYHWQCKELGLFQLSFADDLILLCKAEVRSVELFRRGLDLFASLSGLHTNPQKIHMILSKAANGVRIALLETLGFQEGRGWNGVGLSFAGRVQLIKSVLLAFEVYWAISIAKGVIREIVKRIRTFLWKGNSSSGYPKVAWESVCKPIEEGGQGIRDILALNRALMSRHLWSVIKHEKESIWVDWIARYRLRDASIWMVNAKRGAWSWRKMLELRDHGCNILMDTASFVLMGAWRRTTTYSLLAVSPDTALLLSKETSDFNGLMWSGNEAFCGPRPDGEERNFRKFQHKTRPPSTVVSLVIEEVKRRILSASLRHSISTQGLYRLWQIPWPVEGNAS
ncbi:Transposon TX1 uncharacterized protein [Sesamum angolense]|uniref:Transposon TX1 uncharacterized protein n=1 Tax=Sesamum angolense TaxID=2727404 RepID=A0AAE1T9K7_9LAMI|nr:Transposon TX1 uncharacterized protein [Sesamum angolense]